MSFRNAIYSYFVNKLQYFKYINKYYMVRVISIIFFKDHEIGANEIGFIVSV